MDLDFYKGFEYQDSVSVSKELWNDILAIDCLDKVTDEESLIPEGFDGAGEKVSRISLNNKKNEFLLGFSRLLIKFTSIDRTEKISSTISHILKIMSYLNDDEITHFRLDV